MAKRKKRSTFKRRGGDRDNPYAPKYRKITASISSKQERIKGYVK